MKSIRFPMLTSTIVHFFLIICFFYIKVRFNSCQISVLPEVTHAQADTHWSGKLLAVSGCIPSCQPLCHRVKSVGWLVLVIRPVSHYAHTQGKRFASAQRRNLSILLTVNVRCALSVFTIAPDSPQALFYSATRNFSSPNWSDLCDIFPKWLQKLFLMCILLCRLWFRTTCYTYFHLDYSQLSNKYWL